MAEAWKVVVTGDHESLKGIHPMTVQGRAVEWIQIPVLDYERLPISDETLAKVQSAHFHWLVFTSPRSVKFWTETLLEKGIDLPIETQVACIGEATANVASNDGYTPDFYPTESGSEQFAIEFEDMISNIPDKPSILILQAENGRTFIAEALSRLGCTVSSAFLYRSRPKTDRPSTSVELMEASNAVLFTSPSSFEAFKRHFPIPKHPRIGAMGTFTREHLKKMGIEARLLPEGDFQNIGDLLC